jgi:cytochrome c553
MTQTITYFFLLSILSCSTFADQKALDLYLHKIKPILKERCFACHGALKQKGKLRVDTVANMHKKDIITDGEFLERLTTTDEDDVMPPEGEPLSANQIKLIEKWLAAGAPAPENEKAESDPKAHWSFQKINRPKLPSINEKNPIDAFLRAKQDAKGLVLQKPAGQQLLLRRLYLDLIGLPPTSEQLADKRPVVKIIDSLLSSKQYGQRWARHWMDIWRYSDWYGLGNEIRDSQKHLWRWREWIIDSLNDNKGYDKMVSEMLAGDEVAPNDPKILAATGFLARSYYKFNRTTWLDNTIEHTSKAFMGLTMNCAKCHDHKYDPIDHVDYYKFRAFFEPYQVRVDALPDNNSLTRVYDGNLGAATYLHKRGEESRAVETKKILPGPPSFITSTWEAPKPIKLPMEAWLPGTKKFIQDAELAKAQAKVKKALANLQKNQSQTPVIAQGKAGSKLVLTDNFAKSRPELWELVGNDWRYQGGLLSLIEPSLGESYLRSKAEHPQDFELNLKFQTTGGKQWKSTGIRFDVDNTGNNSHTIYASAHGSGKVHLFHTVAGKDLYTKALSKQPIKLNQEYTLSLKVRGTLINVALDGKFLFAFNLPRRQSGKIELFAYDSMADFYAINLKHLPPTTILKTAKTKAAPIATAAIIELAKAQLKLAKVEYASIKSRIDADNAIYKKMGQGSAKAAGLMQFKVALAKAEVNLLSPTKAAKAAKQIKKLKASLKSGEVPAYKPLVGSVNSLIKTKNKDALPTATYANTSSGRRTALANWLTHRDHPLTARVAVNHIWLRHFGSPLVDTVFDFGLRAPKPLHQDLLDYLAVELIESGWDMKHLHRLMLSSKTWQLSSTNLNADKKTVSTDMENLYYWRMNNRRMESQVIRDSLLQLAGTLDLKLGGPSIKPSPNNTRRSLYFVHSRDDRSTFLSTFDDADVFSCYQRSESIVPQQALALMNSQTANIAASQIAEKLKATKSPEAFIKAAFFKILARQPTAIELTASMVFLKQQPKREYFISALINHNDFLVIR